MLFTLFVFFQYSLSLSLALYSLSFLYYLLDMTLEIFQARAVFCSMMNGSLRGLFPTSDHDVGNFGDVNLLYMKGVMIGSLPSVLYSPSTNLTCSASSVSWVCDSTFIVKKQ